MRTVRAARYVMPFRQGGSVPALVEADDLGLYVVKLRGAGQGAKVLVAELVTGELARAAGLDVPEIVLVELDRELAASEPDPELCLPLEASAGLNLGLDYLPGSITYDPVVGPLPDPQVASRIVLLDAFVANVDRTPRNATCCRGTTGCGSSITGRRSTCTTAGPRRSRWRESRIRSPRCATTSSSARRRR